MSYQGNNQQKNGYQEQEMYASKRKQQELPGMMTPQTPSQSDNNIVTHPDQDRTGWENADDNDVNNFVEDEPQKEEWSQRKKCLCISITVVFLLILGAGLGVGLPLGLNALALARQAKQFADSIIVDKTGNFNVTVPTNWNFQDANGGNQGVYRMYFLFDIKQSLNTTGVFNVSMIGSDNKTMLRLSFNGTDNTISMEALDSQKSQLDFAKYQAIKGLQSHLDIGQLNAKRNETSQISVLHLKEEKGWQVLTNTDKCVNLPSGGNNEFFKQLSGPRNNVTNQASFPFVVNNAPTLIMFTGFQNIVVSRIVFESYVDTADFLYLGD